MKTKFKKQEYLLLTTGNDRRVSIIICKSGLRTIKNKIIQAILDDFHANKTILLADTTIIENGATTIFKARIDSDSNCSEEYFKLIYLAAY